MHDPEERHALSLARGYSVAWTTNPGFTIVSHDNSKELEREKRCKEKAIVLKTGDKVTIEGVEYTVKINGERYSDPIAFE